MEEKNLDEIQQLISSLPGGIAKLAINDVLTILYATDSFYRLIQSVTEKYDSSIPLALYRFVYSADIISVTQQLSSQKHKKDGKLSFSFRILQQDGSFKWIMITGSKSSETYQYGTKTVPVYTCMAVDLTDHMVKHKVLEQSMDYQRTLTDLSKELNFEYVIAKDTLTFSTELFREIFGKEVEITGFRNKLNKSKLIHQEELPAVIKIFNSMMSGKKQVRFEVRLITKEGVPCSYTCFASIIFDENKNPSKVIGKLVLCTIINEDINGNDELPEPKTDPVLGICTQDSAENIIKNAMKKQKEESQSALLLLELRKYKSINEITSSLNGEDILVTFTDLLKSRFRKTDVIGFLGNGEFVVYIKDIQSYKIVYDMAEHLCKKTDELLPYHHNRNNMTISIGIAFHKGKKMEFQQLFANASTALVMAENTTTSSFEVYDGIVIK